MQASSLDRLLERCRRLDKYEPRLRVLNLPWKSSTDSSNRDTKLSDGEDSTLLINILILILNFESFFPPRRTNKAMIDSGGRTSGGVRIVWGCVGISGFQRNGCQLSGTGEFGQFSYRRGKDCDLNMYKGDVISH